MAMKQCRNGDACIHPDKLPGGWLDEKEFSQRRNQCKKCHSSYVNVKSKETNHVKHRDCGETGRSAVIRRLAEYEIGAVRGKKSPFHVDLVAWGFVQIEVKTSKPLGPGKWQFNFHSQKDTGIKAHLVVLVPLDESGIPVMFSVFPATHQIFFRGNKLKNGVPLFVKRRYPPRHNNILTMELMEEYEDAWHQVWDWLAIIGKQLKHGIFDPRPVVRPIMQPLPLFEQAGVDV